MIKRIALILAIIIIPSICSATERLVSATTGTDAGNCTSTPCLTLNYALGQASASDTITMSSGTYQAATYVTVSKAITINSSTPYGAVLQGASGQGRVVHIASDNVTFGSVVFDGSTSAGDCVTWDSVTARQNTIFNGSKFLNPTNNFINTVKAYNLTLQGGWIAQGTGANKISILSSNAGSITLKNGSINILSGTGTNYVLNTQPSVTGVTCDIENLTISLQTSTFSNEGIISTGCSTVIISNNAISTSGSTSTSNGIVVNNHATLKTDYLVVSGNTLTNTGSVVNSYGIFIGSDGTPATRDNIKSARIYNNSANGFNHGIICGWLTDCWEYNNTVSNSVIGVILKETANSRAFNNVLSNISTGGALRSKAGVGDWFYNNTVITGASSTGPQLYITADGAVNSSGLIFKNNIVYSSINNTNFVRLDASQGATFDRNLYFTTGSIASTGWVNAGNNYSTMATWKGSSSSPDENGVYSDPLFSSGLYTLKLNSPAISMGTIVDNYTHVRCDISGFCTNKVTPDAGAYFYH